MRCRITKCAAMLAILCVLLVGLSAPAFAAGYSKVYGQTQTRVRVRASASSSATILDNIVKDACVYVTDSKTSGSKVFVKVNYRDSDGNENSGWVCQRDGSEAYVKILSNDQAKKSFSVSGGKLPSRKVGTFTAAERKKALGSSSTSSSDKEESATGDATIREVQTMLKKLGYYSADITGHAGDKTKEAIKKFQREYDLTADGVAGPNTYARLKAVYKDAGGTTSSSSSTSSSGSALRLHSTGTKVRDLQQDLTTLGYYWAEITGNYGSKTEQAVKTFQQRNNLTADGVAGKKTLDAIADAVNRKGGSSGSSGTSYPGGTTLKLNSTGTAVTQLQTDLKQLGYYYGSITGKFGDLTEKAVKEFQKAKGLNADGVAGRKTLDMIETAIKDAGGSASDSTTGLKVGSTGEKVTQLQQDLTALGYYYGDITGHYGSLTKTAVKKFQKAKGITQDGIAGTTTLNAIAKALGGSTGNTITGSLRRGDKGAGVLELQTMLKSLDYYYGDLTGSFGSKTESAVRKFQDDQNLTVDGIAGVKTIATLRKLTGSSSGDSSSSGSGSITSSSVAEKDSFFLITQDNVRLRTTYSLNSKAKTSMDEGHPVQATRKYNVAGTTWYNITVKKGDKVYTGYVRAKVLRNVTKDVFIANGGNINLDASEAEILGMIRITGNDVSLREEPDSSSDRVAKANKGDVFYYVDKSGEWFQVKSGYWVKDDYAVVMTEKEMEDYLGSGNNSGGTYREGDTGSMVKWIQTALKKLEYYSGTLSGTFGSLTKEAVRQFQRDHGLSADGVAGPKTIAKLTEEYNKATGGESGGVIDKAKTIYNVDWATYLKGKAIKKSTTLTLTDIARNVSFKVKVQSTGNHADVEPLTAKDTQALCSLYGVSNADQLKTGNYFQRRAMVVTNPDGYQFVGSIYAIPHGADTVSGNDFDGQFCLHFLGSEIHAGDGGSVKPSENHQAMIKQAVSSLKGAGYIIKEDQYP